MCGIVAAVAQRNVVPILLEGLRRLEYRGYDSAGVAVINGTLQRLRSIGRVARLAERARGLAGNIGIAHTRWATHGAPSERNAHPHISGTVSVVHNGIVENYEALRHRLQALGYRFDSETDTEVIAHLVHLHLAGGGNLLDAVRRCTRELAGAYAFAVIAAADPARLVVARMGTPLLLGLGDGENFAASDTSALLQVTRCMLQLEDGDCAEVSPAGVRVLDSRGQPVARQPHECSIDEEQVELGGYRHYMQKEIFEQPAALAKTIEIAANAPCASPHWFGAEAGRVLAQADGALLLACGTSYHAGMIGRCWLEGLAAMPCSAEIASEYRYRESVPNARALVVAISQSGETADTLAALQHAKRLGQGGTLSICNVPESALVRSTVLRFLTRAGPEIGVASTKAFTAQLAALLLLAIALGKLRGRIDRRRETALLQAVRQLPEAIAAALHLEPAMRSWAEAFAGCRNALFLGRGIHYPVAMEGALKLKEISYLHAEAYAAGELKHGPLALVDRDMPVIAVAPNDALFDKLNSNLQEVRARGGELYVLADRDSRISDQDGVHVVRLPRHSAALSPIVYAVPLQLLAYHAALNRGNDVDKPRNLAKSVTVE